jgi:hypothetical protein
MRTSANSLLPRQPPCSRREAYSGRSNGVHANFDRPAQVERGDNFVDRTATAGKSIGRDVFVEVAAGDRSGRV